MPSSIDEIRNKIGVREMVKEEREDLLKKFKDAGGEVLDEVEHASAMSFDRDKQRQALEAMARNKDRLSSEFNQDLEFRKRTAPPAVSRVDLFLWLEAFFTGVARLLTRSLPKRFFQFFSHTCLPAMRGAELMAIRMFQVNQEHNQKIQIELTKNSLVYFELIEKFGNVYNETACRNILSGYFANPDTRTNPESLEEEIKALFKQIYLLKPYQAGLSLALRIGLKLQGSITGQSDIQFQIKNADMFIEVLMDRLFQRLYLLLCIIQKRRLRLYSEDLDNYLEIRVDERVGYYKPQDIIARIQEDLDRKAHGDQSARRSDESETQSAERRKVSSDELLPPYILSGFEMVAAIDVHGLLDELAQTAVRYDDLTDKTLVTFLFLKEFEREYSFLLTSSKINIEVIYENKRKINMRDKLNDLFVRIESVLSLFENYWEAVKDIKSGETATVLNEVQHFNKMQGYEARRGALSFKIKSVATQFFTDLSDTLSTLFEDLSGLKRIIQNPGDTISFDPGIEGKKKLDGKTISEMISAIYDYIRAVCWEMGDGGALGGIKVHLDAPYFESLKSIIDSQKLLLQKQQEDEKKRLVAEGKVSKEELEKQIDNSSIFNELEDILKK